MSQQATDHLREVQIRLKQTTKSLIAAAATAITDEPAKFVVNILAEITGEPEITYEQPVETESTTNEPDADEWAALSLFATRPWLRDRSYTASTFSTLQHVPSYDYGRLSLGKGMEKPCHRQLPEGHP